MSLLQVSNAFVVSTIKAINADADKGLEIDYTTKFNYKVKESFWA